MGLSPFSSCQCTPTIVHEPCNCDEKIRYLERKLAKLPNPNPRNFRIQRFVASGNYLVVLINYPDCTNYEGNKIMIFEGIDGSQLEKLDFIDPHFCCGDHLSPIARFEPTDRGWDMACKLMKDLSNEQGH